MNRTVLFTIALLIFSFTNLACQTSNSVAPATVAPTPIVAATPLALKYEDLVVGEGRRAMWGQMATVKYVGKLMDGTIFEEGKFDFKVGDQGIIKGFNLGVGGGEGVEAMKVGSKRKVVLPPELAYGPEGDGRKIPPNATITFELELVKTAGGVGF